MKKTEDPLLALIVRFVVSESTDERSDEEFNQRQLATLEEYVGRFPVDEKQPRAMQWIERHAENYRREWQRKVLPHQAAEKRCKDCPLNAGGSDNHCTIHGRWLKLLQAYLNDKIDSGRYVHDALELLRAHKSKLRIAEQTRAC